YLLGEEFDRDPFLIFTLRGINREELLDLLGNVGASGMNRPVSGSAPVVEEPRARPEPLAADAAKFWGGGSLSDDLFGEVEIPPVAAALPKRLGSFPFWRG